MDLHRFPAGTMPELKHPVRAAEHECLQTFSLAPLLAFSHETIYLITATRFFVACTYFLH